MNKRLFKFTIAAVSLTCGFQHFSQASDDAVLLRLDDEIQQVRVEALDASSGRWLAIASGYRDAVDSGWLKIALPDGYEAADLRVLANAEQSPFIGKIRDAHLHCLIFCIWKNVSHRLIGTRRQELFKNLSSRFMLIQLPVVSFRLVFI